MTPIELGPIPDPEFPEGSQIGSSEGSATSYERAAGELLHRPHAFALMHGDGGAKVAYGELHWRVDVITLRFETSTASGVSVTVDDHANHSHAPHADHSHSDHTDHSHSSHTTTNHQHTIASDSHDGHTHSSAGSSNYATSSSGGNSADVYDTNADSSGTSPQGSAYHHKHGGLTGFAGSETLSHSGVKNVSDGSSSAPTGVLGHSNAVNTDGSSLGADSAGVLKHSGVTTLDSSNQGTSSDASSSSSGVLSHNVTVSGGLNAITYCSGAAQEEITNITQQVPNVDTKDGKPMKAFVHGENNEDPYHQLSSYGDVYLVWEVDLEKGRYNEVTNCWVQIGEPDPFGISSVDMGTSTTGRRDEVQQDGSTEGTYHVKLGSVSMDNKITQNVTSDVVWSPTVMDRIGP